MWAADIFGCEFFSTSVDSNYVEFFEGGECVEASSGTRWTVHLIDVYFPGEVCVCSHSSGGSD